MADPPVLLEVWRGDVVESRHRGRFVVLDADGSVGLSAGDVDAPMLPRSSLKPFQATAMRTLGFGDDTESLALACASHDGEPMHVAGVRRVLSGAGLDEHALGCPEDLPGNRVAMLAWVAAGGLPARVCHNCSGKHAAMVATCAAHGWDVGSYLDPAGPLQVEIRSTIERVCSDDVRSTTVDGCGAPAFAISLAGLARGFAALATAPAGSAEADVSSAMRSHPQLVGGTGRAVSELTAATPGLVCKDGAEGVWGAALPDGRAFAAKVDDGGARALGPVLAAALTHWGIENAAVAAHAAPAVAGGGRPVGGIRWSAEFRDLLGV